MNLKLFGSEEIVMMDNASPFFSVFLQRLQSMKPSVSQYKQHDIEWAESSLTRFDLQGSLELLNKQNIICNVSLYVNETPSALKTNQL